MITGLTGILGIVLVEAHAINRKGEVLAMGKMDHTGMAPEADPVRSGPATELSADAYRFAPMTALPQVTRFDR